MSSASDAGRLRAHAARRVPPVVLSLFAADVSLALLYLLDYAADRPFVTLSAFLDLGGEQNLPTWYASIKWFCIAALLGVFVHRHLRPVDRRSWWLVALPLMFLAMSLDEVAQIHEWLGAKTDAWLPGGSRDGTIVPTTGIWMLAIGLPFLAVFALLIRTVRRYFLNAHGALYKLCLGVLLMLAGALGVETLSNFVPRFSASEMSVLLVEELLEMAGATTVLWGSLELAALALGGMLPARMRRA